MASVDSNVLIRLIVHDDQPQAAAVVALLEEASSSDQPLLVPISVVLEIEWVLRSRYGLAKDAVLGALVALLETRELEFQLEAAVERCIHFYRQHNADFGECLHLACALGEGRLPLWTFDLKASRLPGASRPSRKACSP